MWLVLVINSTSTTMSGKHHIWQVLSVCHFFSRKYFSILICNTNIEIYIYLLRLSEGHAKVIGENLKIMTLI